MAKQVENFIADNQVAILQDATTGEYTAAKTEPEHAKECVTMIVPWHRTMASYHASSSGISAFCCCY